MSILEIYILAISILHALILQSGNYTLPNPTWIVKIVALVHTYVWCTVNSICYSMYVCMYIMCTNAWCYVYMYIHVKKVFANLGTSCVTVSSLVTWDCVPNLLHCKYMATLFVHCYLPMLRYNYTLVNYIILLYIYIHSVYVHHRPLLYAVTTVHPLCVGMYEGA